MLAPETPRDRTWGVALFVGLAVVIAALPRLALSANVFDGGIGASGATFTLHALLPYRDYWLLYGPLTGIVLAIPTAILGPSLELLRVAGLALTALLGMVAYLIAVRWTTSGRAALVAGLAALVPAILGGIEPLAWSLAMVVALAAILMLAREKRGTVLIGLVIGLIFLTRLDVGGYALLAALVWPGRSRLILGFALVSIPFGAIVLTTTPLASVIEQLIWFPVVGTRQFRGLPGLDSAIPASMAVWLTGTLVLLPRILIAAGLIRAFVSRPVDRTLAALAIFALLCQLQTLGRQDLEHVAQASTPAFLLLTSLGQNRIRGSFALLGLASGLILSAILLGYSIARGFDLPGRDADLQRAARIAASTPAPDEPIYVGATRHRHTYINPLMAYYFADRPPGTKFTMFNPGVTNTDATQTRMVSDLIASSTRVLLLDDRYADAFEPYNESRIPGSTILDEFIAKDFCVMCIVGDFRVMIRTSGEGPVPACPDPAAQP